jgi:hypothetical protein
MIVSARERLAKRLTKSRNTPRGPLPPPNASEDH